MGPGLLGTMCFICIFMLFPPKGGDRKPAAKLDKMGTTFFGTYRAQLIRGRKEKERVASPASARQGKRDKYSHEIK